MFGTRLSGPISNNSFAYDERKKNDPDPMLRIPSIETIQQVEKIQLGTTPCFAELDQHGVVKIYTGLQHIYHLPSLSPSSSLLSTLPQHTYDHNQKSSEIFRNNLQTSCYIFDNHNYALGFRAKHRYHTLIEGSIDQALPVIHIDQHSDLAKLSDREQHKQLGSHDSLAFWQNLSTEVCHVGNFIHPALDAGLISECIWIKNDYDLIEFAYNHIHSSSLSSSAIFGKNLLQSSYILDIDLDFRAPEMGTDLQTSIPLVQSLMKHASLITIATSPYFLDQDYALFLLGLLFSNKNYQ